MEKKNTDYSNSVVNLVNHEALNGMLQSLAKSKLLLKEIEDKIEQLTPKELIDQSTLYQDEIMQTISDIQMTIEERGSYQDLDRGWYAVKQRKVSKSYDAGIFEKVYPQFSPAIIIKAVDTVKLGGLIKGGLITEESLKINGVVEEKESFQYIIKV